MRSLPLLLTLVLTACGVPAADRPAGAAQDPTTEQADQGSASEVDIDSFAARKQAGKVPLVIDVRTDREYNAGHVAGTRHIPLDQLPARLGELEAHKDQPVYLICQSGARSGRATQLLASKGFDAVNVQGGTGGWIAAGHPVEK